MTESRSSLPSSSKDAGAHLGTDLAPLPSSTQSGTSGTVGESAEPVIVTSVLDSYPPAIGRIPIVAVGPVVDGGRWPAKAVVGEQVPITATVFREGHDAVAATAVLIDPDGAEHSRVRMVSLGPGLDRFGATVIPDRAGHWTFRVEGWSDVYGTWEHDAVIKIGADVDVELMLVEGALVLERALATGGHTDADSQVLRDAVHGLRDGDRPAQARLAAGIAPEVHAVLARTPLRDMVTCSPEHALTVQRELALFSAYEDSVIAGTFLKIDAGKFEAALLEQTQHVLQAAPERAKRFLVKGTQHTIGNIHTTHVGDESVGRWLTRMLAGDPDWQNVLE